MLSRSTGSGKKVDPRLRECCRQSQAEVVSKSSNKIHQTRGPPFSRALYRCNRPSLTSDEMMVVVAQRALSLSRYRRLRRPRCPDFRLSTSSFELTESPLSDGFWDAKEVVLSHYKLLR